APGERDGAVGRHALRAGAEDLPRAQHHRGQAARTDGVHHGALGIELGARVAAAQVRARLEAVGLVHALVRPATGVVEHAQRAHVDQPPAAVAQAGLDDVARAPDGARLEVARAAA